MAPLFLFHSLHKNVKYTHQNKSYVTNHEEFHSSRLCYKLLHTLFRFTKPFIYFLLILILMLNRAFRESADWPLWKQMNDIWQWHWRVVFECQKRHSKTHVYDYDLRLCMLSALKSGIQSARRMDQSASNVSFSASS